MILDHNINGEFKKIIQNCNDKLDIYTPYIKVKPLVEILSLLKDKVAVTIVTSWKANNFAYGSSDLEIFSYCSSNNIHLKANNRVHLKVWLIDEKEIISTSANISYRAIGVSDNSNHEFFNLPTSVDINDIDKLNFIKDESIEIKRTDYENMKKCIEEIEIPIINDKFDLNIHKNILPYSQSVKELWNLYNSDKEHNDIDLLNLSKGLSESIFLKRVKVAYFNLPIIKFIIRKLELNDLYWRDVCEIIKNRFPDDHNSEIKIKVSSIYNWLPALHENFIVEQHNISENLHHKKDDRGKTKNEIIGERTKRVSHTKLALIRRNNHHG
jgi:hypothetical protein